MKQNYNSPNKIIKNAFSAIKGEYIGDSVLLYQMGKVGSSSIKNGLRHINRNFFHVHSFSENVVEKQFKNYSCAKINSKRTGENSRRKLKYFFLRTSIKKSKTPVKIITLVREPISCSISRYFQDIHIPLFDFPITNRGTGRLTGGVDALIHDFKTRFSYDYVLNWYDEEFKRFLGIDVFEYDFDKEKGFCFINKDNYNIMVIQMEKMNSLEDEIREFLDSDDFKIINNNMGTKKWYSSVYKEFKDTFEISENEIDELYKSKYVTHFYSDKDINTFKKKYFEKTTDK